MDIQDAVAVVTGAGVGGGLAIARRLLDAGARVTLTNRTETEGIAGLLDSSDDRAAGGVVVNIGSTAGLAADPYDWLEYAAAKAGLIRATTCLANLDGARVNCVVPDWLATDRALAELAALPEAERAKMTPPIPLGDLCDAVTALVEDDTATGRVVVLNREPV